MFWLLILDKELWYSYCTHKHVFIYYLLTVILTVYSSCHKYMWTSQYVRSRTGRLLLEQLAEDENYQQETDKTSVSTDIMFGSRQYLLFVLNGHHPERLWGRQHGARKKWKLAGHKLGKQSRLFFAEFHLFQLFPPCLERS